MKQNSSVLFGKKGCVLPLVENTHLMGDHDKGKAVLLLKELFSKKFKQIRTVGVGNQFNDVEMLEAVDMPFFIVKPEEIRVEWEKIISLISSFPP